MAQQRFNHLQSKSQTQDIVSPNTKVSTLQNGIKEVRSKVDNMDKRVEDLETKKNDANPVT